MIKINYLSLLDIAIGEATIGLSEGGIPIGAALFNKDGTLLGKGRNRRIQNDDPSLHGETDAFRNAGRQRSYSDIIMATTLAPCWYCSGLIRQFKIKTVVVCESLYNPILRYGVSLFQFVIPKRQILSLKKLQL